MLMICATGADRERRSIHGVLGVTWRWLGFTGHSELGEKGLLFGVMNVKFSGGITNLGKLVCFAWSCDSCS